MKRLFYLALLLLPLIAAGQDRNTRDWSGITVRVKDLEVLNEIKGDLALEFASVEQMLGYDYSQVKNGSRIKCNGYHEDNDGFFGPDVIWNDTSTATADGLSVFAPDISGDGRLVRAFDGDINIRWSGASEDLSDNSPFIQTVIDYVSDLDRHVYVPGGRFEIDSTLVFTGNYRGIYGDGSSSKLYTTTNIPMVRLDTSSGSAYSFQCRDLTFIGNVSGTRTSNAAIEIYADIGTAFNYCSNGSFSNILFLGTYYGIRVNKAMVGTTGETGFNWNVLSGLRTVNYGANHVHEGISFEYGSGTGNVITSCTFITDGTAIRYEGNMATNQYIGTVQAGSTSTTVVLDSGASASDDAYNGFDIKIETGTAANEFAVISDYVGSTRTATVSAWGVTPVAADTFSIGYRPNVGDIVIGNCQFGGGGSTGLYLDPLADYRHRVSLVNCQFDGGVAIGIDVDSYGILRLLGVTLGGATINSIVNCDTVIMEREDHDGFEVFNEDINKAAFRIKKNGDSSPRLSLTGNGIIFGDGTTADASIYRDSAASLAITDDLRVNRNLFPLGIIDMVSASPAISLKQTGDSASRFLVNSSGQIEMSNSGTAVTTHIRSGTGTPEGVVTAPVSSIFFRSDGGPGTTLYIKESGVGNTGWVGK